MCPDEWSHVSCSGKALVREMLKLDATSEYRQTARAEAAAGAAGALAVGK
jgi:hypothetical protein